MSAGIAWGVAARLLAEGATPAVVAEEAGGTAAQIARRRCLDRGFRRWIEAAREDPKAAAPPADSGTRAERMLAWQAHLGDPRALAWQARGQQTRPRAEEGDSLEEILGRLTRDELAEFVAMGDDAAYEPSPALAGFVLANEARAGGAGTVDARAVGDGAEPGDDPAGDGGEVGATPASGRDDGTCGTPPPPVPPRHLSRYPPPVPCPRWWEGS